MIEILENNDVLLYQEGTIQKLLLYQHIVDSL